MRALAAAVIVLAGPMARLTCQTPVAFTHVNVIPMDRDTVLTDYTVVVEAQRISAFGPSTSVSAPAGARVIDGRGKYLMPGLGDAHAHLSTVGGGPELAERALQLFALKGVTMVRSMYTEPHHRAAVDRVERGEIEGPHTFIVSPPVNGQTAPSPSAAAALVRAHHAAGYRVIKVLPGLSPEAFDSVDAAATQVGVALAGHVPSGISLERVLRARYVSIDHLDGFLEAAAPAGVRGAGFFGLGLVDIVDEHAIPGLVAAVRAAGVTIVPTEYEMELSASIDSAETLAATTEMRYAPVALVQQWSRQKGNFIRGAGVTAFRANRFRDLRRSLIRQLHVAGVPIALGSDAFNMFDVPGFGTQHELEALVAAGLRPYDALAASTRNVARLVGLENEAGVLGVGKLADMLLLDGDPCADVRNVRRQAGVMLRGQWLPADAIARRLASLATTM